MAPTDTSQGLQANTGEGAGLQLAVRQLQSDCGRLAGDTQDLAFEVAKALGRAAFAEARKRPVTTAAIAIAAASTALAALSRRQASRLRASSAAVR
jgi:hypothetical protein